MASNPMRLTDEAYGIAMVYGPTVSKGIVQMAWELEQMKGRLSKFERAREKQ